MKFFSFTIILALQLSLAYPLFAQQVADTTFKFPILNATFKKGEGPLVMVDVFHNNQSVVSGNYNPFLTLLEHDGYQISYLNTTCTKDALKQGKILVIINPLAAANIDNWTLPVFPAFSTDEIEIIYTWVIAGGSLMLVADHMPFPEAAASLAQKFGAAFCNGFAIDTLTWDPLIFKRSDQTLKEHPTTRGRDQNESIDSVATFWGQAFTVNSKALVPLFTFGDHVISFNPDTAWRFRTHTPVIPVNNWCQAAAGQFGKGRVLILGEAGMLTAQFTGQQRVRIGMNAPVAKQNPQFILNAMRWLSSNKP